MSSRRITPGANGSLGTSEARPALPASAAGSTHRTSRPGPAGSPSVLPTGSVSVRPNLELSGGVSLNVEYEITQPVWLARAHAGTCLKSATVAFAPGMIADTSSLRTVGLGSI